MSDSHNSLTINEIHEQLALYKMIQSSDFGSWIWEPESGALYFNNQYMKMLGYEHDEFPRHISTWEERIHPDDRQITVQQQMDVLSDSSLGNSFESRYRLRNAAGEYVWILGRGFVLERNEKGQAIRVSGMHVSLAELEKSIEALALQHDRMSFALEAGGDGLWDWNAETGEVYFSPRYMSMLGYTADEFPPHVDSWAQRVHPDDYAATVEKQHAHIATPENGDVFDCFYRVLAKDGSNKWILGRGKVIRRNAQGRGTRVVGLHTDVTELHNVHDSLMHVLNHDSLTRLHSRFFFETLLEQLTPQDYPVSIIFADVDGMKLVNTHLGHAAGDLMLSCSAALLRESLPRDGIIARVGGDEFAILLRNCPEHKALQTVNDISRTLVWHNAGPNVTPVFIAIGHATAMEPTPMHRLMARADMAMQANKMGDSRAEKQEILQKWIEKRGGQPVDANVDIV